MNNRTALIPRCTIVRHTGEFCDAPSVEFVPFPICGKHAVKLYRSMQGLIKDHVDSPAWRIMFGIDELERNRARADAIAAKRTYVVYYLLLGDMLKIGTTSDLHARIRTYPPHRKLLATEPGGYAIEGQRHRQFAHLLAAGNEWFRFEGDLVEHVKALRENVA